MTVKSGTQITAGSNGTTFRTLEDVNFKFSSSYDPRDVEIFETDSGAVTKYLLKKRVKAQSGTVTTKSFTFANAEKYKQIKLPQKDIIEIISCVDNDGNSWYEVDSLARDTIFEDIENNVDNSPSLVVDRNVSPYLLKLKKTSRRFTTFINQNDETLIRFGAGVSDTPDEELIPNPDNVGSNLPGSPSKLGAAVDPSNFL